MTYKVQIDDLVRDATAEEIAEIEAVKAEIAVKAAEEQAKVEAKEAAQAKLAALGLTVEDLQALGL
jgi:Mn-containing catalase